MRIRLGRALSAGSKWVWSYSGSSWILIATALVLAVWVVPFQLTGQPQATIEQIAWNWWPVRILYALLGVSTAVCTWQRLRRDARRLKRPLNRPEVPPPSSVRFPGLSSKALAETLERRGYRVTPRASGFDAVLHRWSPLGGSIFHFALLAFVAAIVVQHAYGSSVEVRVTEGQSFSEAATGEAPWAQAAVAGLTLESIAPTYYRDVLLFTRLDATLGTLDGDRAAMSLANPRWLDPFTHLSVQDYGLAPHISSADSTGTVLDDVVVAMNIFPPGAEDSVTLVSSGLDLAVVAYPDYGIVGGEDVSLTYNVRDPAFRITAQSTRDGNIVGRRIVRIGEPMDVGAGTVTVTDLSRYGTFRLFRSYAPPLAMLAGLLTLLGLLVRFGWPRHDVIVWEMDEGVAADAWLDGFDRHEGRTRLARLLKEVT